MKTPGCNLYYQYNLSKGGKVYKKSRKRICHSFVAGFAGILYAMIGCGLFTEEDTGNTSRTSYGSGMALAVAAGSILQGSVVGIGTNAVDVTDYGLQTIVAHGSGGGQLQYSACTVALPTFTSSVAEIIVTRLFTNASGGTIAVEEIGLYANNGTYKYCIVRDLSTISVTNGTTLTLNYILQTTL